MNRHLTKVMIGIMIIFTGVAMSLVACGGAPAPKPAPTPPPAPAPAPKPAPAKADPAALRAKGEEIYQKTAGGVGCKSCHGAEGRGVTNVAPDVRGKTADDIRRALGGDAMRFIRLTDEDIEAVAVYLKSLESR